jgi:hypothetical protein
MFPLNSLVIQFGIGPSRFSFAACAVGPNLGTESALFGLFFTVQLLSPVLLLPPTLQHSHLPLLEAQLHPPLTRSLTLP